MALSRVRYLHEMQVIGFRKELAVPPSQPVLDFMSRRSSAAQDDLTCCRHVQYENEEDYMEFVSDYH